MTNLKKIKRENGYHSKKEYNSAILARSTKNKAMIGFTSVAVGGGVFLGLLVPGLLPVVLSGAPVLAMSTNITVSAVAGSIVGATHYAVNRKEGKLRKYTKKTSKGFRYKFEAEIDDAHTHQKANKSNKQLGKGKSIYDHYFEKLEALKKKNEKLQKSGASASALDKNNKKIKKLEEGLSKLDDSYLLARQMYQDDLNKKLGQANVAPITPAPTTPAPTVDATEEKDAEVKVNKKSIRDRLSEKFTFTKPSKIIIENNEATKRFKLMLNLDTPTLEANAKYYESKVLFDKYTPTRATRDRKPIPQGTPVTDEMIAKQAEKLAISDAFDDADYNFLEFENFVNDSYNLPIGKGKTILKVEFESPELDITYEMNDYQKSNTKPLFVINSVIDLMKEGKCGPCIITNQIVDENGILIDNSFNSPLVVNNIDEALNARDIIYSNMLNNLFIAQKVAYKNGIKSEMRGLDVVLKACDLAMPSVEKTAENIAEDVFVVKGEIKEDEKTFFETQFLGIKEVEINDTEELKEEKTKDA